MFNSDFCILKFFEYYPFGMLMPGRSYTAGTGYRYGFNGKEKVDEVYGQGNTYDYGFRIYNPRIGKFLSVDPLTSSYPWFTPYQFAGNSPLMYVDLDGAEGLISVFLPNPFSEENTAKLKQKYKIEKGSFWDKAIDFVAGAGDRARDLNNPITTLKGVGNHLKTLGSNVGKIVTANSDGERAQAIINVLLPSTPAAIQTGYQLKAAVNGDMRAAGGLATDAAVAVIMYRLSGSNIQSSELSQKTIANDIQLKKVMEGADDWRMAYYKETPLGDVISPGGTAIELDIVVPKGLQGQGILTNVMKKAVEEFNPYELKSTWKYDAVKYKEFGGMSTNLKEFLKNREALGDVGAAWETPTGKAAKQAGFTQVSVNVQTVDGKTLVEATFSK